MARTQAKTRAERGWRDYTAPASGARIEHNVDGHDILVRLAGITFAFDLNQGHYTMSWSLDGATWSHGPMSTLARVERSDHEARVHDWLLEHWVYTTGTTTREDAADRLESLASAWASHGVRE